MSGIISVLPDYVANQIAAGEVIQQASSVVKELMENAIDAGATQIDVIIKDAGKTLIQVNDNGKGMSADDALLCFERHATSKLRQADDLFHLQTKGFRGEALASIAAIAQVELQTRRPEDELGCKVCIAASKIENNEAMVLPSPGTRFMVRNLFYNVPARRKFLGSNAKQFLAIRSEFVHIALAHSDLGLSLTHNGESIFDLQPGNLRQRIISLFGNRLNKCLYPIEVDTEFVHIGGFIGDPATAGKRSSEQFLFANRRFVRHPYFRKAILDVYETLIPSGMQPAYFLFLDVPTDSIDVNISPTKTEVKFEHEQVIWPILNAAVRECLGKFNAVPSIDFDQEDAPSIEIPSTGNQGWTMPQVNYDKSYNPFNSKPHTSSGDYSSILDLYDSACHDNALDNDLNGLQDFAQDQPRDVLETLFNDEDSWEMFQKQMTQVFGRYLLLPLGDQLLFIDQHRASVRILFERYCRQLSNHQSVSQSLLFAEEIDIPPYLSAEIDAMAEMLDDLGFRIEKSGTAYLLTGVPQELAGKDAQAVLQELLQARLEENPKASQSISDCLALEMAQSMALPYGQNLDHEEQCELCRQLFAAAIQNFTPDGKSIIVSISLEELTKRFQSSRPQ